MPAGSFAPPFAPPGYPGTYPGQAAAPQPQAFAPQQFAPQPQAFTPQQFAPQPAPAYAAIPQQAPAWNAAGVQPANPSRPVFRGQADDDPEPVQRVMPARRPAPLNMPSPEALGLTHELASQNKLTSQNASIDWTAVHSRLNQLGATCFQLDHPTLGAFRVTCLLPSGQPGRTHRIEAQADSETEVVRLVLAQAEEWVGRR